MFRWLWLFIFLPLLVSGQQPLHENRYIDSLQNIIDQKNSGDSLRTLAFYNLSGYHSQSEQHKARAYLKAARKLSKKYPYLVAGDPFYEALILPENDVNSLVLYKKSDSLLAKFKTPAAYLFRSKIWLNYASVLQFLDRQAEMVDIILKKAIPLAKKAENPALLAYMYSDLAVALANIERYEEAKTYFKLSIEGLKHAGSNSSRKASVYVAAAATYCQLKELQQAGLMLEQARLQLIPSPKALVWPDYYAVESLYLNKTSNYSAALKSADKGLVLAHELQLAFYIHSLLLEKLEAYKKLKKYQKAEEVFKTLQKDETFLALSQVRKNTYKSMAEVYANTKQFDKAYDWMRISGDMSDSIAASKLHKEIAELEMRFRSQENLHQIALLKAEQTKIAVSTKNNRLMILLLVLIVVFTLLILLLLVLNIQKKRRLIVQGKINYEQQIRELAQQKQLQISAALIEGEERERRRMATDLHDGLGSKLAGVKLHLSALFERDSFEDRKIAQTEIVGHLDTSLAELRRIARNLMPETLIQFGLQKAISDLCLSATSPAMEVDFQALGMEQTLPEKTQIMIYRIVQELLANAMKHSNASAFFLQCSQSEQIFLITAEDDGLGFDMENYKPGIGLQSIRTRVGYLNGRMHLQSAIGKGTIINIELNV